MTKAQATRLARAVEENLNDGEADDTLTVAILIIPLLVSIHG